MRWDPVSQFNRLSAVPLLIQLVAIVVDWPPYNGKYVQRYIFCSNVHYFSLKIKLGTSLVPKYTSLFANNKNDTIAFDFKGLTKIINVEFMFTSDKKQFYFVFPQSGYN